METENNQEPRQVNRIDLDDFRKAEEAMPIAFQRARERAHRFGHGVVVTDGDDLVEQFWDGTIKVLIKDHMKGVPAAHELIELFQKEQK